MKRNCKNLQIPKFQSSANRSKIVKIFSNLVCVLVLLIPTPCESFKSFGAFLDIASYLILNHNFQNKQK